MTFMFNKGAKMMNNYNPFEAFDIQKMLSAAKFPNVDIKSDDMINAQKKNMEAFAAASKAIFEGVNSFSKKQVEILNKAISSAKDATSEIAKGNPQDSVVKSIELTAEAIKSAQANVVELSKVAEKTSKEAFEIMNARFLAGMTEFKNFVDAKPAKDTSKEEKK